MAQVYTFIGYFEVTWHLAIELFSAKILRMGNIAKSVMSEGNRVTQKCWGTTAVTNDMYWHDQHVWVMNWKKQKQE